MQYCIQYVYNNVRLIILYMFWILPFPSSGRALSVYRNCQVHIVICNISTLLSFLSAYPVSNVCTYGTCISQGYYVL